MKRYEKMSKEELVKLVILGVGCEDCPLHKRKKCKPDGTDCIDAVLDYLNGEATPRIAKINTEEELGEAHHDFEDYCGQRNCLYGCKYYNGDHDVASCFMNYLLEEE